MFKQIVWSGLLLLMVAGCYSGKTEDKWTNSRPARVFVAGTVTYDGKPLPDATVVFQPVDGQLAAVGRTGPDGKFRLTTFDDGDGAVPGNYNVGITCTKSEGPPPGTNLDEVMFQAKETSLIPEKYGQFETSGLRAEVTEENEQQFDFAIRSN